MNRYLTALLVLLAATGVEAQAIESALVASSGYLKMEEILSAESLKALDEDILSAIRQIQSDQNENNKSFYFHNATATSEPRPASEDARTGHNADKLSQPNHWKNPAVGSSIHIRAPSTFVC